VAQQSLWVTATLILAKGVAPKASFGGGLGVVWSPTRGPATPKFLFYFNFLYKKRLKIKKKLKKFV
jgi:hypothetical protein